MEKNNNDILRICKEHGFSKEVTEVVVNYCIKFASSIADNWSKHNVKTYEDLKLFREKRKEVHKLTEYISKIINKELILYEKDYLDKWIFELNVNSKDIIRIVENSKNVDFNEIDRTISDLKEANKI